MSNPARANGCRGGTTYRMASGHAAIAFQASALAYTPHAAPLFNPAAWSSCACEIRIATGRNRPARPNQSSPQSIRIRPLPPLTMAAECIRWRRDLVRILPRVPRNVRRTPLTDYGLERHQPRHRSALTCRIFPIATKFSTRQQRRKPVTSNPPPLRTRFSQQDLCSSCIKEREWCPLILSSHVAGRPRRFFSNGRCGTKHRNTSGAAHGATPRESSSIQRFVERARIGPLPSARWNRHRHCTHLTSAGIDARSCEEPRKAHLLDDGAAA